MPKSGFVVQLKGAREGILLGLIFELALYCFWLETEKTINMSATGEDSAQLSPTSAQVEEMSGSHDPGKMFIGGLSCHTSADALREYFGKYGEVNECMVMRDPATKRARGFGFITFADPSSVEKVLAQPVHVLDDKKIDPKVAFPKRQQPKMVTKTKKVFVGGLSASTTVEDMKTYFEQFGKMEDAMLMFDKTTQRHRGFGFITFEDENVVEKVCEIHFHEINGKMQVECKKAQPKEVMLPLQLTKNRAAAARGLYGLPEQLLASYAASCLPRLGYGAANVYYPVLNGYQANYMTPTSPGGRAYANGAAAGTSPQSFEALYHGADMASYMQTTSPQPLPHSFHMKNFQAPPLITAAYNGYH